MENRTPKDREWERLLREVFEENRKAGDDVQNNLLTRQGMEQKKQRRSIPLWYLRECSMH